MLTDEELDRYARHLVLREMGGPGQARIRKARLLIVGGGGLGSPAALYLAAAGVGTLGLVDDDAVSLSNLQRQVLFATADVGRPKVEAGAERLSALNPGVRVRTHHARVLADNVMELIADYDIVLDGSDNFPTRFLLNDACYFAAKTLVSAAVTEFEGQLATYKAFDKTGPHPCYRCLFPEPPPPGTMPSCSETGVLGAAAGVMGSLAALEALKEAAGIGASLAGKVLTYRALTTEFRTARLPPDPACPLCGGDPVIRDLRVHAG
jgi:adenylyltransferase/sulfurtransferase